MIEPLMSFLMPMVWVVLLLLPAVVFLRSIYSSGPTEVGLVPRRGQAVMGSTARFVASEDVRIEMKQSFRGF